MEFVKDMKRLPCGDCGCKVGEYHQPECDHERCPKCGGQLISCGCFLLGNDGWDQAEFEKYEQEVWSGIFFEEAKLIAEKNNIYVRWDESNKTEDRPNGRWLECKIDHPDSRHDLNVAIGILMRNFVPKLKK